MSKPSPARCRTRNWSSYNASFRKRGAFLIWLGKDMTWLAPRDGRRGRPAALPDAAIQFCLSIKILFKLPLRQTSGMVARLLKLVGLDWPVPDFSTLCRRQKTLAVQIPCRRADCLLNLLVDGTGTKFPGNGEWQARKYGVQKRCQWRKVHLAMDPATSDIRAVEFTPSRDGPSRDIADAMPCPLPSKGQSRATRPARPGPGLRTDRHGERGRRLRHAPLPQGHHRERDAVPVIPIGKNGRLWKDDCPAEHARNDTLRATRHYRWAFWKRWTTSHSRRRIEARMLCLKAFGERIMARYPDRQTAEVHIRIALMKRCNALGTAEIVCEA